LLLFQFRLSLIGRTFWKRCQLYTVTNCDCNWFITWIGANFAIGGQMSFKEFCILLCIFRSAHQFEPTSHGKWWFFCERSVVEFRELFQQLFGDSYLSKLSSFVRRWGIHLALILPILQSRLIIVWATSTEIPTH
jgi:hypothetical protein